MVKLGLSSYSYHLHLEDMDNPRDALWFLRKTLELGLDGCHFDPRHLQGWNDELIRLIGSFAQAHGLYLELGSGGFDYPRLAKRLHLAAEVGARVMRTFIGGERHKLTEPQREQLISSAIEGFRRLSDVAQEVGVPIAIENHEDLTSRELISILEAVDSPYVRAYINNGNCFAVWEEPLECVCSLTAHAAGANLKDLMYRWVEGVMEREGCPLGHGEARVADVYAALRQSNPDMPITLEIPTFGPRYIVRTLAEEEENVVRSIAYIRRLEQELDGTIR